MLKKTVYTLQTDTKNIALVLAAGEQLIYWNKTLISRWKKLFWKIK